MPGLQARQTEQVIEHVVKRGDTFAQHLGDFHTLVLRKGETARVERCRAFDNGDAATEVVRRGSPRFRAGLLHCVERAERSLQGIHVPRGRGLLQAAVLRCTSRDAIRAQLCPQPPRGRHDRRLERRVVDGVAFQFGGDAHLQIPPLAENLAQRVPLLPSLESMLGDLVNLDLLGDRIRTFRPCLEALGQQVEHRWDVIVELHARQRSGDVPPGDHVAIGAPGVQDRVPAGAEIGRKCAQLLARSVGREHDVDVGRG